MQIACYKGISLTSKAIRFMTRSVYSHVSLLFDKQTNEEAEALRNNGLIHLPFIEEGSVIEAWEPNGVRNTPNLRFGHERGTEVDVFNLVEPLSHYEETKVIRFLAEEIGAPYDFKNVFRFVTKRPGYLDKSWFCSELAYATMFNIGRLLFEQTQAWEVPPDWIARSPLLRYSHKVIL